MVVIFSVPPDPTSVCLEAYSIHIVTGLIKQWLRELPDPIMTFNHYSDFLRAVGRFLCAGKHVNENSIICVRRKSA